MNERAIFTGALDRDAPADRAAYLDAACAGDPALRARVEALLQSHEGAGAFPGKLAPQRLAEEFAGRESDDTRTGPSGPEAGEPLDFLDPSDKPGALGRLGHYEVREVIGRGGMGVVLRAFDENLHRVVAIKVMAPQLATSATARKRFTREARAQAAVTHDHIVTIHAVEESGQLPYIVMQFVAGQSLQDRLDRTGPLQLHEVLRIGMQAASGLAAAHAQGLVHRDVKPANILLENGVERVKITDFGLARAADDASLTQSGTVAGTPAFMSPEQAEGKPLDHRSDLFSLGSVLYAMCTGRPPFRASTGMGVLKRVCEDVPTPVREANPEVPDWLAASVEQLHAKDPAARFQSAAEVAEVLGRHLAQVQHPSQVSGPAAPAPLSRPRTQRWAVAAAVLAAVLATLGATEATGVTKVRTTVIRFFTPDGALVVEADDPDVKVTVEGNGDLVISGAGVKEVRLPPGSYKLRAAKDGQPVELDRDLVTISRGDTQVVRVRLEGGGQPDMRSRERAAAKPAPLRLVRRLTDNPAAWVDAIQFAPDSDRGVVTSYPKGIDCWDLETGEHRKRIVLGSELRSLDFLAKGTRLVGVTHQGHLIGLEWPSGQALFKTPAHAPTASAGVKLSRERFASTGFDGLIRVWDAHTGEQVRELPPGNPGQLGAPGQNYSLAVSPDERYVVAGGASRVRTWDLPSGKSIRDLGVHPFNVWSVAISPDSRYVLTGGHAGLVQLFELDTGNLVRRFDKHTAAVASLAFLPDGRHFVSGALDGTLRVWSLDGREVAWHESSKNDVSRLALAPDGRRVLTAGAGPGAMKNALRTDATLQLWELPPSVWPTAAGGPR